MKIQGLLLGLLFAFFTARALAQPVVSPDTQISLERTMCYGTCPAYQLMISADGKVVFEGKEFVGAQGHREKTIPVEAVAAMLQEVDRIRFFELTGKYDCYDATDNPSAIVSVTRNGQTKAITHYHGCRSADPVALAGLTRLEDAIDLLADIADWLKFLE